VRELMNIADTSMAPLNPALLEPPAGLKLTRQQGRVLDLLRKGSANKYGSTEKTWSLDFFRSPAGLAPPQMGERSCTLTLSHTVLDDTSRALPTGETSTLVTDLVVTSLGQHSDPSTPFYDGALQHLLVSSTGRVLHPSGRPFERVYASGWAAMGARGVLASTLMDAYNVADNLVAELGGENQPDIEFAPERIMLADPSSGDAALPQLVREGLSRGDVTTYEDWKLIDAEEVRRGGLKAKERERMGWTEAREFLAQWTN